MQSGPNLQEINFSNLGFNFCRAIQIEKWNPLRNVKIAAAPQSEGDCQYLKVKEERWSFKLGPAEKSLNFEREIREKRIKIIVRNFSNELGMILMENVFGKQNIKTIPDWESCRFAKKSRHLILLDIVARIQHKKDQKSLSLSFIFVCLCLCLW